MYITVKNEPSSSLRTTAKTNPKKNQKNPTACYEYRDAMKMDALDGGKERAKEQEFNFFFLGQDYIPAMHFFFSRAR